MVRLIELNIGHIFTFRVVIYPFWPLLKFHLVHVWRKNGVLQIVSSQHKIFRISYTEYGKHKIRRDLLYLDNS